MSKKNISPCYVWRRSYELKKFVRPNTSLSSTDSYWKTGLQVSGYFESNCSVYFSKMEVGSLFCYICQLLCPTLIFCQKIWMPTVKGRTSTLSRPPFRNNSFNSTPGWCQLASAAEPEKYIFWRQDSSGDFEKNFLPKKKKKKDKKGYIRSPLTCFLK